MAEEAKAGEKAGFVSKEGDKITFDLAGLRKAAAKGASVLGVVADDIVTAAERAGQYGKGVLDRAEDRLHEVSCPSCGTAMIACNNHYHCPSCGGTYTPLAKA